MTYRGPRQVDTTIGLAGRAVRVGLFQRLFSGVGWLNALWPATNFSYRPSFLVFRHAATRTKECRIFRHRQTTRVKSFCWSVGSSKSLRPPNFTDACCLSTCLPPSSFSRDSRPWRDVGSGAVCHRSQTASMSVIEPVGRRRSTEPQTLTNPFSTCQSSPSAPNCSWVAGSAFDEYGLSWRQDPFHPPGSSP